MLTEDVSICGAINREDVVELVVKAIFSEKTNGKVGLPINRDNGLCPLLAVSFWAVPSEGHRPAWVKGQYPTCCAFCQC